MDMSTRALLVMLCGAAIALHRTMAERDALWSRAQRAYDYAHGVYFETDPLAELWSGLQAVLREFGATA